METERNHELKSTYKRPYPAARLMGEEMYNAPEPMVGEQENGNMKMNEKPSENAAMMLKKQEVSSFSPRREKAERAQVSSAQLERHYENYRDSLTAYENNLKKEAQDKEIREKFREIESRYIKQWDAAQENAKDKWLRSRNENIIRAEEERDKLRTMAEQEKQKRLQKAEEEVKGIQEKQQQAKELEEELQNQEEQLTRQLADAQHYKIQGYDCERGVQQLMQEASAKKYISAKQASMISEPVEKFCAKWTSGVEQLKKMESDFLATSFMKRISYFEVDEDAYRSILFRFKFAVFAVFFLVALLAHVTKWDVILLLASKLWMVSAAGFFYLAASFFARIFKIHKNLKVRDSLSGIIAWVIAVLMSALASFDTSRQIAGSIPFCIGISAAASATIGAFFNLFLIRNIVIKLPFIINLAYRDAFCTADSREEQERKANNLPPMQKDLISAMVCCYINHDEILQYLSTSAREQAISDLDKKIQENKQAQKDILQIKEELNKQAEAFLHQQDLMIRENQETDKQLLRQLEEVNRRYGAEETPDFNEKKYLLPEDVDKLEALEEELEENGIPAIHADSKKSALRSCENFQREADKRLEAVQKEIGKNIDSIRAWMYGAQFPPDKDKDGTYRYCIDSKICMSNIVDKDDRRPVVIEHNGYPVVFRYTDKWDIEYGAIFVCEIWNGFARMIPEKIMSIFVVETAKSVSETLKSQKFTLIQENLSANFRNAYNKGRVHSKGSSTSDREQEYPGNEPEMRVFLNHEIESLRKILEQHQEKIVEYVGTHNKEMDIAGKEISCSAIHGWQGTADIARVNYCKKGSGNGTDMSQYRVVIFVVPEGRSANGDFVENNIKALREDFRSMIEAKNGKNYGILPVFVLPEHLESKEWEDFVQIIEEKNGTIYQVSLRNQRIKKAEKEGR